MRKLAISFDPHIWINVHSGMEVMFCFSVIVYTFELFSMGIKAKTSVV